MQDITGFEHESMVVVYDPADGRILHSHTHHDVTLEGKQPADRKAMEREAAEHIPKQSKASGQVAFLHVDPSTIDRDAVYKVDINKLQLVEIPRPKRREAA